MCGHRLCTATQTAGRRSVAAAIHRVVAVASRGVGQGEGFSGKPSFRGRSAVYGPVGEGWLSGGVRTARARLLAFTIYVDVYVQTFSRLLTQQHSRRVVQSVAGEDPVSLCDAGVDIRGGAGDQAVMAMD